MSWIWLIITGLLAFGDCCATAQVRGPFELPGSLRRFRFPQTFIADCALPLPRRSAPLTMVKSYAVGKVTVNVSDSILVAGRDEHGEAWDLVVDSSPGGCWLWRSDLDRNGREDLIILVSDAGSGGETVLTLIMIDALGRPVPWQAVGRFEPDTRGLRNLVDMNRDGRAELLYFYVEGYDRGEARAMSITSYEIKDAHLERRDGRRGGSAFPIVRPSGSRLIEEPDLTNAINSKAVAIQIVALGSANSSACKSVELPIVRKANGDAIAKVPEEGNEGTSCFDRVVLADGRTFTLPEIVVLDLSKGRRVAMKNSGDVRGLMSYARDFRLGFYLAGRVCDSSCHPYIFWASDSRR